MQRTLPSNDYCVTLLLINLIDVVHYSDLLLYYSLIRAVRMYVDGNSCIHNHAENCNNVNYNIVVRQHHANILATLVWLCFAIKYCQVLIDTLLCLWVVIIIHFRNLFYELFLNNINFKNNILNTARRNLFLINK